MYCYSGFQRRLKSRRSFIAISNATQDPPELLRLQKWREEPATLDIPTPPA